MTFQKGNQLAKGGSGYSASIRQTRNIISRAITHELNQLDPKSQLTKAQALVKAMIDRGIRTGDPGIVQECGDRTEGKAVARNVHLDMTPKPGKLPETITPGMTSLEAGRIYRASVKGEYDPDIRHISGDVYMKHGRYFRRRPNQFGDDSWDEIEDTQEAAEAVYNAMLRGDEDDEPAYRPETREPTSYVPGSRRRQREYDPDLDDESRPRRGKRSIPRERLVDPEPDPLPETKEEEARRIYNKYLKGTGRY